jgi:Ca2+-binding EF-hand superfamily protein
MMTMKLQLLTALVTMSMLSGVSMADRGGNKFLHFFDANSDGMVTMDEFTAASSQRFIRMDADKNGQVSQDEFKTYMEQRQAERSQARYQKMDSNGDGQVSQTEYVDYQTHRAERKYARMDKDGNGVVSKDEYANVRSKRGKHYGKRIFGRLDGNGDGTITRAESLQAWTGWFEHMDANHDSVVTAEEIKHYRETKRSK